MYENKGQGWGVAEWIGGVKWTFIGTSMIIGGLSAINAALDPRLPDWLVAAAVILTGLWCMFLWISFGWGEFVLKNLIQIERNTRPRASEWVTPGSEVDQEFQRQREQARRPFLPHP